MFLTTKQIELIKIISKGNEDGSQIDLDELIERASYKPTKQSIQFSIRTLIKHGLIVKTGSEKRRGRRRVLFTATDLGNHFANNQQSSGSVASSIIESEIEEFLE